MQTIKANNYSNMVPMVSDFLDRTINFIDNIQSSKVVKVLGYAAAAVAGIFALGGLLRVLAWTTAGWNKFSLVLNGK